jgi:hypothetical protein
MSQSDQLRVDRMVNRKRLAILLAAALAAGTRPISILRL